MFATLCAVWQAILTLKNQKDWFERESRNHEANSNKLTKLVDDEKVFFGFCLNYSPIFPPI
jgi:hypothetical protein